MVDSSLIRKTLEEVLFKMVSAEYPSKWITLDDEVSSRLSQLSMQNKGSLFAALLTLKCMVNRNDPGWST